LWLGSSKKLVFRENEALLDYFGGGLDYYWIRFGGDWITTGLHVLRPNWSYIFTGPVSISTFNLAYKALILS
jgi:hypothetical protein